MILLGSEGCRAVLQPCSTPPDTAYYCINSYARPRNGSGVHAEKSCQDVNIRCICYWRKHALGMDVDSIPYIKSPDNETSYLDILPFVLEDRPRSQVILKVDAAERTVSDCHLWMYTHR